MLCNIDSSQHLPANRCQGSHAHQSFQLVLHRHAAMEAVVMETGESAAAADGTVTMEIAAAAPVERADTEVQRSGAAFPDRNYRMLIVIGELCNSHHLDAVRNQIAQALLSWNVDLTVCDLDKELQVFKAKHTAQFSAQVKGQSNRHTQTLHVLVFLLLGDDVTVVPQQRVCGDFVCPWSI
ncbi:Electromotor neuron-associated protein 1 [Takifugu flavidus]|uniref:Electromotor neuron-associated protein 1 n=1 Tax=Takifugu flavidus TaxID=433684 RepID=A0A5C6NM06_9TELE|nr:Electromotor neuron-associated protein 1 [Takifugu flavidus]